MKQDLIDRLKRYLKAERAMMESGGYRELMMMASECGNKKGFKVMQSSMCKTHRIAMENGWCENQRNKLKFLREVMGS